ncbi:MAG: hypothetical protein ACTSQY_00695 [Candidatus Odinarchaeia archaeon]
MKIKEKIEIKIDKKRIINTLREETQTDSDFKITDKLINDIYKTIIHMCQVEWKEELNDLIDEIIFSAVWENLDKIEKKKEEIKTYLRLKKKFEKGE